MKTHALPTQGPSRKQEFSGLLLHSPRAYDVMVQLFLLGREHSFRERLLAPAALRDGDHVLDVGCGTGSLAIAASRHVGSAGRVVGIDASAQMIVGARRKAARGESNVEFRVASAQALPFPTAEFDVVLSTLMLHHLPRVARYQLACEARRVLKPAGRLLVVDFDRGAAKRSLWQTLLRHRHGSIDPGEVADYLDEAGFEILSQGPLGIKNLTFALGVVRAHPKSGSKITTSSDLASARVST